MATIREIPDHLRKPENRFILLVTKDKKPLEKDWVSTATYSWNDPRLLAHLAAGGNYGVLTGAGGLIVVDFDSIPAAFEVVERFPPTFTAITGGGGLHKYFHISGIIPRSSELSHMGEHVGDLLSTGKQAVGPNCFHPNGTKYYVCDDIPIAEITTEELNEALLEFLPLPEGTENTLAKETALAKKHGWTNIDKVPIAEVIDITGLRRQGRRLQGPNPVHGSETGRNFVVDEDKGLGYCFRHHQGGGAAYWFGVTNGILKCGDPSPRGKQFKAIVEAAYRQGLLTPETPDEAKEPTDGDDKVEPMPCTGLQDLVSAMERDGLGYLGQSAVAELALLLVTNLSLYLNGGSGEGKSYVAERLCDFVESETVGYASLAGLYQSKDLDGKTLLITEWDMMMSGKSRDAGTEAILRATIGAPEGARRVTVVIGTRTGKSERIEIPVCHIIACSINATDDEQWRTRFHFFPIHYTQAAFEQQCRGAPRLPEEELDRWKKTLAIVSRRPVKRDPELIEFIVTEWTPIPKDGRQTNLMWSLVEAHAQLRGSDVASMQDFRGVYDIVHDRWTRPPTETAATLWELLYEAGTEGVALADMIRAVHRSEPTIKRYLKAWRELGLVQSTSPAGGRAARWIMLFTTTAVPGDPVLPPPPIQTTGIGSGEGDSASQPSTDSAIGSQTAPVAPPLRPCSEPVSNPFETGSEPIQNVGETTASSNTSTPISISNEAVITALERTCIGCGNTTTTRIDTVELYCPECGKAWPEAVSDEETPLEPINETPGRICLVCGKTTTSKLVLEELRCPYCGASWPKDVSE